jgi:AcrR family transcriptional regulator
VLDAFIALVAEDGLEAVTLDRVAREAGVQRGVIRHFVGNRAELVRQAVGRIAERYEAGVRGLLGPRPSTDDLLDALFGDPWVTGFTRYDRAYAMLLNEIAGALRRQAPGADAPFVRETAYAILCLAEHNATMISLGHPAELSVAARRAATDLAARVVRPDPAD